VPRDIHGRPVKPKAAEAGKAEPAKDKEPGIADRAAARPEEPKAARPGISYGRKRH